MIEAVWRSDIFSFSHTCLIFPRIHFQSWNGTEASELLPGGTLILPGTDDIYRNKHLERDLHAARNVC